MSLRDWLRDLFAEDEGTYRQQLDKFAAIEVITDGPAHRQGPLKGLTAKASLAPSEPVKVRDIRRRA